MLLSLSMFTRNNFYVLFSYLDVVLLFCLFGCVLECVFSCFVVLFCFLGWGWVVGFVVIVIVIRKYLWFIFLSKILEKIKQFHSSLSSTIVNILIAFGLPHCLHFKYLNRDFINRTVYFPCILPF